MRRYICNGTKVSNGAKDGIVINVDNKSKVAVMRSRTGYWTDNTSNLTVVSYEGVVR